MVQKSLKLLCIAILMCLIFSIGTVSAPSSDSEIYLLEGDIADIQDGYSLGIADVDTYDGTVRFIVYYYDISMLDQYYAVGDYFYYEDSDIALSFKITDIYYEYDYDYGSYNDYVIISDVYVYPDYSSDPYVDPNPDPYPDPYPTPDRDPDYGGLVVLLLLLLVVILILRKISRRRKAKKEEKGQNDLSKKESKKKVPTILTPADEKVPSTPVSSAENSVAAASRKKPVVVKSAIQYKGANILYKIKVENNSDEPMGDIKIGLFVPDVFLLKEDQKNISMLQPGEGKTATFLIRPTGECGNCILSSNIRYYDYLQKKHVQMDLSNKMVDIICPVLKVTEINENAWRVAITSMMVAEEDTKDLEIPAENLFDIATRILKDMNMYMITPEITSTQQLFTGVARFYAQGVAGTKYAAYIEVVGKRKSRLIVKAWAEKEEALTGFYHKILEEIEKRTDIKLFVDDSTTQYINNTTIQDSVIQRSNIGYGKKKCPQCGREAGSDEKFCVNCGQKLE